MSEKIYTILDLAEEFGKDKQSIRRRIARLRLQSVNNIVIPITYGFQRIDIRLAGRLCLICIVLTG